MSPRSSARARATTSCSCATRPRRSTCSPASLPEGTRVLSTPVEHHANMLPWRRHDVELLPFTRSPARAARRGRAAAALPALRPARGHRRLERHRRGVAASPSSRGSRTGYGAKLFVDAAQLAPHRAIDMAAIGHRPTSRFSGHKLYAPFGAGALVGRALVRRRPAAARRRRDQARHARRRHLGRRARPLRGGLAERDRRRRARRGLPAAARGRHGRGRRARARARRAPAGRARDRAGPADAGAVARARRPRRRRRPSTSTATATSCSPRS